MMPAQPNGRADITVGTGAAKNVRVQQAEATVVPIAPVGVSALAEAARDEPSRPQHMTEDQLKDAEPDIVDALFEASTLTARQVAVVEIERLQVPQYDDDGKALRSESGDVVRGPYAFRIRGLHHEQLLEADRRARRIKRPNERGKIEHIPDPVDIGNWVVYLGTVPEDRQRKGGWDDKRMHQRYSVGNGPELIEKLLLAGEKEQAAAAVRRMSRLNLDEELVGESSAAEAASSLDSTTSGSDTT
jgi:hypothetical protein